MKKLFILKICKVLIRFVFIGVEIESLSWIPGIGKLGAERIQTSRKERKFTSLQQLANLKIASKRAAPFILLDGRNGFMKLHPPHFIGDLI